MRSLVATGTRRSCARIEPCPGRHRPMGARLQRSLVAFGSAPPCRPTIPPQLASALYRERTRDVEAAAVGEKRGRSRATSMHRPNVIVGRAQRKDFVIKGALLIQNRHFVVRKRHFKGARLR